VVRWDSVETEQLLRLFARTADLLDSAANGVARPDMLRTFAAAYRELHDETADRQIRGIDRDLDAWSRGPYDQDDGGDGTEAE
jgi:hypothetical protein